MYARLRIARLIGAKLSRHGSSGMLCEQLNVTTEHEPVGGRLAQSASGKQGSGKKQKVTSSITQQEEVGRLARRAITSQHSTLQEVVAEKHWSIITLNRSCCSVL